MDRKYLTIGACVASLALAVLMTPVLASVSQAQRAALRVAKKFRFKNGVQLFPKAPESTPPLGVGMSAA